MKPLAGLQDIQGIDAISVWPLAVGWWLIAGAILAAILFITLFSVWRKFRRRSWQYQMGLLLNQLEVALRPETSQAIAIQLAALTRRLAIHSSSREDCASLEGRAWLNWLTLKDPRKFNWSQYSEVLIEAPFKPHGTEFDLSAIKNTINAAKGWVKSC